MSDEQELPQPTGRAIAIGETISEALARRPPVDRCRLVRVQDEGSVASHPHNPPPIFYTTGDYEHDYEQ